MWFGSGLSVLSETTAALDAALERARGGGVGPPDVLLAFATHHHAEAAATIAGRIADAAGTTSLGCLAEGVIGGNEEADSGPGLAVWAARLPEADVRSVHLEAVRTPDGIAIGGWSEPDDPEGAVLIADPFTFPAGPFTSQLGARGVPVVGGFANAGRGPGGAALMRDGVVHDRGAVALVLGGAVEFRTVVSQGCRPLGEPAVVTQSDGNVLGEVAGRPAAVHLTKVLASLDPAERRLARTGLHIGIVADEYLAEHSRGDFLIRAVMGVDADRGTVTIGEPVAVGRTVQYQVRDPGAADEDLRALLGDRTAQGGVLLFSCNGRGRRFFGSPHHDAGLVGELLRPPAVAGFFAAGEFGPVGGANHVHGYTASLVEIRTPG